LTEDHAPQPCARRHGLTCGCRLTPPDIAERLQRKGLFTPAQVEAILVALNMRALPGLPATARHDRTRAYLTPPDVDGHIHWTGPWPKGGGMPRITVAGERMSLIHFAFREAGIMDIERTWPLSPNRVVCRDMYCFNPLHWTVDKSRGPEPVIPSESILLQMWDADNPRPYSPHLTSWIRDGARDLCRAGHPVNVHKGDLKSAYCSDCYRTLKKWKSDRTRYCLGLVSGRPFGPVEHAIMRESARTFSPTYEDKPEDGSDVTLAGLKDADRDERLMKREALARDGGSIEDAVAEMLKDLG
jgi:hypothetical protein